MLATFLSIIGTAIPVITTEFNSMADAGWYGSAFFLSLATFVSVWGKAYKYFSLRVIYLASILIFEIGNLVCALSPSSIALIIGRGIQGVGAAGTTNGGYTIAAFVVPPSAVPIVIGLIGSVFTIASIAGPLLGGVFTSSVTWRWCFYINLPIGGVTIACMLIFFRTPAHAKVLCFFLALQWGGVTKLWNSADIIGLLVGCVLLLSAFAVNEWYQGDRSGFVFFLNAPNIALQYNLPIYFQAIQGDTPVESGLKMIPSILSTALCYYTYLPPFVPFILATGALAALGGGLIYTFGIDTSLGPVIGYQILYGFGTGIGIQVPNLIATMTSSAEDVSMAIATVSFFLLLAGGWGVVVTNAILNSLLLQKLPYYVTGIDPHAVLQVGAAGIEDAYHGETLRGVRPAYLDGLHGGWALGTAAFGVAFLWAFAPKWPRRLSPPGGSDVQGKEDKSYQTQTLTVSV
ncbi:putative MFS transporter [Hypoxylon crocopeplum]|nr:putative MFS transporter [Hypoxylon crocopeplum]